MSIAPHRKSAAVGIALVIATVVVIGAKDKQRSTGQWPTYGADKGFSRYSPLNQINSSNVKNLRVVWRRPAVDSRFTERFVDLAVPEYFRSTPIMIDGVLYAPNGVGLLEAFDPATGKTIWIQSPMPPTLKEAAGQSTRGVAYWRKGSSLRLILIRGEYLYAVNAKTGEPEDDFGGHGRVLLNRHTPDNAPYFGFNGPIVVSDVIVVGGNGGGKVGGGYGDEGFAKESRPEDIRGFDAKTGTLLWTFHVLPQAGEPGNETWGKDSWKYMGNMAAWGSLTADESLGYVYVPLSAPTVSYYGAHRPGKNLYSDSLVTLDVKTGKLVWYYQLVHHDLWDYDSATPPILGDIKVDGKRIRAVMASAKTGFLYVFDRVTGKPVWPIEERPVPESSVPGEEVWPTQPFPTKPPAFERQSISEDDLIDFTPELHKQALEIANRYVLGSIFTPPSLRSEEPGGKQGTLALPGIYGGGNWNTGAFDPETGIYYAVSHTKASVYGLIQPGPKDTEATIPYSIDLKNLYPEEINGLPIIKPPYGRITALDLNKGDRLWTVAAGEGPRNSQALRGLEVPQLGIAGRPAPLLTKTLLFLGDSSDAMFGGGIKGPGKFRAYDKATGSVIWEADLPVGTTGAPITYLADGKQYIVVAIGGKGYGAEWVAFGLSGNEVTLVRPSSASDNTSTPVEYGADQAQRGEALYRTKCSACHMDDLSGGDKGPALKGKTFWSGWDQAKARSLYSNIISTMPLYDPGSLASNDVLDVLAYILQANGVSPGEKPFRSAEDLSKMKLVQSK
jgi:quinoprotein glucose dehydrogenase